MNSPESQLQSTDSAAFAEKAAQVKRMLADLAHLAPSAAKEQISNLKDSAGWLYEEGTQTAKAAGAKVYDLAKRRPMETALVGVGLGLLVWWLVSRSDSHARECASAEGCD